MMHGREKSDSAIVAVKPTNNAVPTAAEPVEPRAGAKASAHQQSTHRTQGRERVTQALERVRQVRRHAPKVGAVCGKMLAQTSGRSEKQSSKFRRKKRLLIPLPFRQCPHMTHHCRRRRPPLTVSFGGEADWLCSLRVFVEIDTRSGRCSEQIY
jgi:hypothetical protein